MTVPLHVEHHASHRASWLRAAVLGANDGIVSVAALILGVAAAGVSGEAIFSIGMAGLFAGAMSMAAGEYVSVQSQADIAQADLALERQALTDNFEGERLELARIYEARGLRPELAQEVASELMQHNALEAHARDEIGLNDLSLPQPVQAAFASAAAFSAGAVLPVVAAVMLPQQLRMGGVAFVSLAALMLLGALSAKVGGAPVVRAVVRVLGWGALAMAVTVAAGRLIGPGA